MSYKLRFHELALKEWKVMIATSVLVRQCGSV